MIERLVVRLVAGKRLGQVIYTIVPVSPNCSDSALNPAAARRKLSGRAPGMVGTCADVAWS